MNKVYKIIFDPILGLFKVVSELAKGKGKANKGKKVATFVVLSSLSSIAVASYPAGSGGMRSGAGGGQLLLEQEIQVMLLHMRVRIMRGVLGIMGL